MVTNARHRKAGALTAVALTAVVTALFALPAGSSALPIATPVRQFRVAVIATYPHDPTAFTEGLEIAHGRLYESVGLANRSDVREVELRTGKVLRRAPLPGKVFGEGLAILRDGSLVQLSWKNGRAFSWTPELKAKGQFIYRGEGWGLCFEPRHNILVQSDGSSTLTMRDPTTFKVMRQLKVTRDGKDVRNLNELSCDGDSVLANEWLTNRILRISLDTGAVFSQIDGSGLGPKERDGNDVLNGIAELPNGHWLLTGKRWPMLYEVTFQPP